MASAKEFLVQVKDCAVKGSIQLVNVEKILSNDDFTSPEGLRTTTDDGVSKRERESELLQLRPTAFTY